MTDGMNEHVSRRELSQAVETLLAKMDSNSNRNLIYLGISVGIIRFDAPATVTAGALGVAGAKVALGILIR